MTRDEFIDLYLEKSGVVRDSKRTPHGFSLKDDTHVYVALPCNCGHPICTGWAMITDDPAMIAEHNRLYSAEPESTP